MYTHGGWTQRHRVSATFLTRKNSTFFLCSWWDWNPRPLDLQFSALTTDGTARHPVSAEDDSRRRPTSYVRVCVARCLHRKCVILKHFWVAYLRTSQKKDCVAVDMVKLSGNNITVQTLPSPNHLCDLPLSVCRLDMTFTADWALKSIYL